MEGDHEYEGAEFVKKLFNIDEDVINALIVCGLLRSKDRGRTISKASIQSYARFGTIWISKPFIPDSHFDQVPVVEDKIQPPSSYVELRGINVSLGGEPDIGNDKRFLAHFYLEPNHSFFVDPAAWTSVRGPRLKMSAPLHLTYQSREVTLYPSPNNTLGLISIYFPEFDNASGHFDAAYDVVNPIIDELAFLFDQNIHIVHSVVIHIPSGYTTSSYLKSPAAVSVDELADLSFDMAKPELRHATALYREACSSNNIFHQFLTFWRSYENIKAARENWRKSRGLMASDKRQDTVVVDEVIPDYFCFQPNVGLRFEQVIENLRDDHRNAIAHGELTGRSVKTSYRSEDVKAIALSISLMRYIARTMLINARRTLAS